MEQINKEVLAYIIGVALGDGNLSNPNGRATRLRVTCDAKYKNLIKEISSAIQELLPNNKVSFHKVTNTYGNISCYSNIWEEWLGWKVGLGSKYKQKVSIPNWIKQNEKFSIKCLKGLLQTDGSLYEDRGYEMVGFVTIIPTLANDVMEIISNLGFKANIYKIKLNENRKTRYNIRLSRDVEKFIERINFVKN